MKVLVTGGAGFIGSNLTAKAAELGWDVVSCDSFTPYYDPAVKRSNMERFAGKSGVEFLEGDIRETVSSELLSSVDVVFHQAGQPGVRNSWESGFGDYVDLNITATQWLLEKMHKAGTPRLVLASSSSVYGNAQNYPVTEATETKPFSPYGVTKLAAERLAIAYSLNFGMEVVGLRYFTVYGPGQRPDMAMHRLITSCLEGTEFPLYGDGSQIRDFTYVGDAVDANIAAATAAISGHSALNICGGSSVTLRQVMDLVEEYTGRELRLKSLGNQVGDVARTGGLNAEAQLLLGWTPKVLIENGLKAHVAHLSGLAQQASGRG